MQDKVFAIRLRAFQTSCRTYLRQKEEVKKLLKVYPDLNMYVQLQDESGKMTMVLPKRKSDCTIPFELIVLYRLRLENLFFVEKILDKIQEKYGAEAMNLVVDVFVMNMSQETAGKKINYSRRQVQTRIDKVLRDVLEQSYE